MTSPMKFSANIRCYYCTVIVVCLALLVFPCFTYPLVLLNENSKILGYHSLLCELHSKYFLFYSIFLINLHVLFPCVIICV